MIYTIEILTLSDLTPAPIRMTQGVATVSNVPSLSTAPVTLCTDQLYYKFSTGTSTSFYPTCYEWTIPSGWRWPDNTVSNSTPRTFNFSNSTAPWCITVTPNVGGVAGVATVRLVDCSCNGAVAPGPTKSIQILRPRPEVQLSSTAQTITCGRGIEPRPTASMTMTGGVVSYEWVLISQQVQAPVTSGLVFNLPFCSCQSSATLGGYATTGNPGTATFGVRAAVRLVTGGAIIYYSPPVGGPGTVVFNGSTYLAYTVTVTNTVVTPIITAASAAALCSPGQTNQLTATAAGAAQIQWWSDAADVRFTSTTQPNPTAGTSTTPFVESVGGSGKSIVSVSVVGTAPDFGPRVIYAKAINPAKCYSSTVAQLTITYGVPPDPLYPTHMPFTQRTTPSSTDCSKEYFITLPVIPGATSYKWILLNALTPALSFSGSPRYAGVTVAGIPYPPSPTPPQWTIRPYVECGTNGYYYGNNYGANVHYAGINDCGTSGDFDQNSPTYSGATYFISLDAMRWPIVTGTCSCTPGPTPPGIVVVQPVPADERLVVSWSADTTEPAPTGERTANAAEATIELLDLFGQVRLTRQVKGTEHELPTRELPNGPYLLRVRRGDSIETRRIAVQH